MAHHDFWSTRKSVDAQASPSMSAPTAGVQTMRLLHKPSPSPSSSAASDATAGATTASRAAPVALLLKSGAWKKPVPSRRRGPSTNWPVQGVVCWSGSLQPGVPHRPVSSAQLAFIVASRARTKRVPSTLSTLDVFSGAGYYLPLVLLGTYMHMHMCMCTCCACACACNTNMIINNNCPHRPGNATQPTIKSAKIIQQTRCCSAPCTEPPHASIGPCRRGAVPGAVRNGGCLAFIGWWRGSEP